MTILQFPKETQILGWFFNGSSCGLNTVLWSSNFWLPTFTNMTRLLTYNCQVVDIDIGDFFLNLSIHDSLRKYLGVDLSLLDC